MRLHPPETCQHSLPGLPSLAQLAPTRPQLLRFRSALPATNASSSGLQVEPFSWGVVRVWLPVNVIFVGMIGTSFWALRSLNVGMVTGEAVHHWLHSKHLCARSRAYDAIVLQQGKSPGLRPCLPWLRACCPMSQASVLPASAPPVCSAEKPDQPVHSVRRLPAVRADVPPQCLGVRGAHDAVRAVRRHHRPLLLGDRLLLAGASRKRSWSCWCPACLVSGTLKWSHMVDQCLITSACCTLSAAAPSHTRSHLRYTTACCR